jgi:hypothetical protein
MPVRLPALILALAALVTGCQTVAQQTRSAKIVALAGMPVAISRSASVNPDCSVIGLPKMVVIQAPAIGDLTSAPGRVRPDFQPSNTRSECNLRQVQGLIVTYRPKGSASGIDSFSFDLIFPDGIVWRRHVTVDVL